MAQWQHRPGLSAAASVKLKRWLYSRSINYYLLTQQKKHRTTEKCTGVKQDSEAGNRDLHL